MLSVPWDDSVRRRLKLRDIEILMAVILAGGMGKAAHRLRISQPAVSKSVSDLERTLGVRLLERSRRGVELTPYGRVLIDHGGVVFDELRRTVEDIDFLSDPTTGELRIGSTEPIAGAIVSPVIDRLSQQYQRMSFRVAAAEGSLLFRGLQARDFEIALARMAGPVAEEFSTQVLFHDPLVVVTGANNPLARRRKIKLAELMKERWILPPTEGMYRTLQENAFRTAGLAPPPSTVTSVSPSLRNELLATGRYLSIVPGFLVSLPQRHDWIKVLPVELPGTRMPICVVTLKNRSISPLARLFIDDVREFTKPLAKRKS